MKHERCALTIRFGKDIAGLINQWVWQSKMNDVNDHYKIVIQGNDETGGCARKIRHYVFGFNFRDPHDDPNSTFIYNIQMSTYCGHLPKHYWSIKELY